MAGYGDHDRRRCGVHQLVDETELAFWVQRRLQDDDVAAVPTMSADVARRDDFGGNAEPPGSPDRALREHQVVLDHKETPCHDIENSLSVTGLTVLAIAKPHLSLL